MKWQNIKSAPKNPSGTISGPMVLLWCDYDHVIRQAYWTVVKDGWSTLPTMGWRYADGNGLSNKRPTYWMPLPEMPAEKIKEAA